MSTDTPLLSASPSATIVEEVAAREGVDPVDLDVPLYDAIDPEALDEAVRSASDRGSGLRIEFVYHGYDVVVESTGAVHVAERPDSSPSPTDCPA